MGSLFKKAETTSAIAPPIAPLPAWWDRFWAKVDRPSIKECWNWNGSTRKGYGRIRIGNNRQISTHRLIASYEFGRLPAGAVVRHQCDNPLCVNPTHLCLGSALQNMNDKALRGRVRGSRNPRAKLNEEQVAAIRASREPLDTLAHRYAISNSTIQAIRYGRNWRQS